MYRKGELRVDYAIGENLIEEPDCDDHLKECTWGVDGRGGEGVGGGGGGLDSHTKVKGSCLNSLGVEISFFGLHFLCSGQRHIFTHKEMSKCM